MAELQTLSNSLEFQHIIQQEFSLVAFGTPWSSPCRIQHEILVKFVKRYSNILAIARVDVERHQQIAQKCNIQTVPTLIIYRKSKEIKRLVGLQSKESLLEFIQA